MNADAWRTARASVRAHWAELTGTGLVLAAAGAVVTLTAVLMEAGLRGDAGDPAAGMLVTLASSFAGTALVLVLMVVTSTVGLALRQRRHELALLRTVGATVGQVRALVAREVVVLAVVAVPLGALPGLWCARRLGPVLVEAGVASPGYVIPISPLAVLTALALVVPTALLAGRLAVRESAVKAPGAALRESEIDTRDIGAVRRACAALLAVGGVATMLTPTFLSGTMSAATAASSSLLLLAAAACAGPMLVQTIFERTRLLARPRSATTRLALVNLHGFSRRLTAVVLPFALVVGVGTISVGVDRTVAKAANEQLAAAVDGDLVAESAEIEPAAITRLRNDAAIDALATMGSLAAKVRVDQDDAPEMLAWEPTAISLVEPDTDPSVLDPAVTSGTLEKLTGRNTIAVSSDTAFELGASLGGTVEIRLAGEDIRAHVVAVYERGLGVGPLMLGPATADEGGAVDTVIVRATEGTGFATARAAVRNALGEGATVSSTDAWVDAAGSSDAAEQRLSTILLLALLLLVALGGVNAITLATLTRRKEFSLLSRTGATRRQLVKMVAIEALVSAGAAWLLGTVVTLPALLSANLALRGPAVPSFPLATYAVLSVGVLLTGLVAATVAAMSATRPARRQGGASSLPLASATSA